jgi:hypothetical protein
LGKSDKVFFIDSFRIHSKVSFQSNLEILMKKVISALLLVLFVSGCAGRTANPVMTRQYGDETRSCASITAELGTIEGEIQRLIPKTNKTGKNVALGVAGWFFIVPWFFMDLSQAEQEEINAYRMRYNHLVAIAADKGCAGERQAIPDFKKMKELPAFMQQPAPAKTDDAKPSEAVANEAPASNNFAATK